MLMDKFTCIKEFAKACRGAYAKENLASMLNVGCETSDIALVDGFVEFWERDWVDG